MFLAHHLPHDGPVECHILGAGLAGVFMARALMRHGVRPTVWDEPAFPSATRAAAGLVNPITGLRFSKTWCWEEAWPLARAEYDAVERATGRRCWHTLAIDRIFRDAGEAARGGAALRDPARAPLLQPLPVPFPIPAPHGGVRMVSGGWLDTTVLRDALPAGWIQPERMDPAHLTGTIIDCRGWPGGADLPLPWNPAKGEILTLRLPDWPRDRIIMRGIFTVPLGGDVFRVGATYEWEDLTPQPTEQGRAALLDALRAMGACPGEILDHRAGIRPILRDARPYCGPHPTRQDYWIFNGLGSKGALLAPWLADQLARRILRLPPSAPSP